MTLIIHDDYEDGPPPPTHCRRCGRPIAHSEAIGKPQDVAEAKMYGFCSPRCLTAELDEAVLNSNPPQDFQSDERE